MSHLNGFPWNNKMTRPKCQYHQSPTKLERKTTSRENLLSAVRPSSSDSQQFCAQLFLKQQTLHREKALCALPWWWWEKSRPAAMGTDWADWETPGLGTKINSILHILDRLICTSSEEALTMEFMATVRGRLAKGWLVSKTSFIQASQTPVFYLILLAFELLRQNILHGAGERGVGCGGRGGTQAGLLFCAIILEKSSKAESDGRPTDTKFKPCLQAHPCIPEIQEKAASPIFPALEMTHTPFSLTPRSSWWCIINVHSLYPVDS